MMTGSGPPSKVLIALVLCCLPSFDAADWYPKSLPCDVTANMSTYEVSVDCTERGLTKVPNGIPGNVTNITLTINHIPLIEPSSFQGLENLVEIDLRCNCVPIKIGPKDRVCSKSVTVENRSFWHLKNLKSLYLDGNQLSSIPIGLPPSLTLLSLEVNNIHSILKENLSELTNIEVLYFGQNCYYRNPCNVSYYIEKGAFSHLENLTILSLKSNNLSHVPRDLPASLKELYLYNNNIRNITAEDFQNVNKLETLDLSGNCPRCYNAPFPCTPCPGNGRLHIDDTTFKKLKKLKTLRLHSNSLMTVKSEWFQEIEGLQKGRSVIFLDLQTCQHSSLSIILYVFLTSLILGVLTLSISAHLFLWDMWYIYHFCLAKLKGYSRLSSQSTVYDAFIVYDKKDQAVSDWVMEELQVHLEELGDPPLQLCLEERDWIPGCPIIDNLYQSIQQSKKTVFILTNKYVRSGNFKTAFYLAHQRLMDEMVDVILLIFLEKFTRRSKYLRLRKRLYGGSLLEWPSNPKAQPYFWHCLRSAMAKDSQRQYSKLFQETL
ncbi:hypothetical protein SKAU_G00250360 [Synaphobranchus kaupii]|uniref:TIR domain-containing protein n=1 Tax=Synaphobranchus kaupii TaxID=118154 RepID=A0A9Q1F2V1_SYNKA|nr:hypothetical protein SKAU_G00250360 [Synaphobranchus kaupii]